VGKALGPGTDVHLEVGVGALDGITENGNQPGIGNSFENILRRNPALHVARRSLPDCLFVLDLIKKMAICVRRGHCPVVAHLFPLRAHHIEVCGKISRLLHGGHVNIGMGGKIPVEGAGPRLPDANDEKVWKRHHSLRSSLLGRRVRLTQEAGEEV
jgi:hypothetical protein